MTERARRRQKPTFAEIVDDVKAQTAEPGPRDQPRPGHFNLAGRFFDPSGEPLERAENLTPAEAREAVRAGAVVAFEGCGCGGSGGCAPTWFTEQLDEFGRSLPRFVKGYGSPTWIDVWRSDRVSVVFAHGDVAWGPIGR